MTGAVSTRSVAVAEPNDTTAPAALVASTVTLAGGVTVGAVVSRTVTVNEADAVLGGLAVSDAERVTVVTVGPGAVNG